MMYCLEARLPRVFIQDLNLLVLRGTPQWVTEEQYQKSIVLRELVRRGDLTASRRSRSRVSKPPQKPRVHSARLSRPSKVQRKMPLVEKVELTPEQLKELLDKTAKDAAASAISALAPMLNAVLENQKAAQAAPAQAPDLETLEDRVAAVVERAIANLPASKGGGSTLPGQVHAAAGPEEPVYIPTGIVPKDSKGVISVQSNASDSGDLGDAAAALKKLRKERK